MNNIYIKHNAEDGSLTHYGVKGMKWRNHNYKTISRLNGETRLSQDMLFKKGYYRSNGRGVSDPSGNYYSKKVSVNGESRKQKTLTKVAGAARTKYAVNRMTKGMKSYKKQRTIGFSFFKKLKAKRVIKRVAKTISA